jgi:outer membrane lipoprotein-sorting protein
MRLGTAKRLLTNDHRIRRTNLCEHWKFRLTTSKKLTATLLQIAVCMAATPSFLPAQEMRAVSPLGNDPANGSLTVSEVVVNLVARNAERTKALESYTGRRTYRLDYHGLPGNLQSEMIVNVVYRAPSTKQFTVISEKGSKLIINRVFHKLLESEEEALNAKNRRESALNELNYEFTLITFERTLERSCYVLAVRPKASNKFLYRGTIWVDATDFAVSRIEAEPAKNPSFWTKKSRILQTYLKAGNFWMPSNNRTTTTVRFGGKAVLNIDYDDYELSESHLTAADKH